MAVTSTPSKAMRPRLQESNSSVGAASWAKVTPQVRSVCSVGSYGVIASLRPRSFPTNARRLASASDQLVQALYQRVEFRCGETVPQLAESRPQPDDVG